jgi:hypothetical protein
VNQEITRFLESLDTNRPGRIASCSKESLLNAASARDAKTFFKGMSIFEQYRFGEV